LYKDFKTIFKKLYIYELYVAKCQFRNFINCLSLFAGGWCNTRN